MREAEQRLKAIPQFCFPDAKDWSPVSEYSRYKHSSVIYTVRLRKFIKRYRRNSTCIFSARILVFILPLPPKHLSLNLSAYSIHLKLHYCSRTLQRTLLASTLFHVCVCTVVSSVCFCSHVCTFCALIQRDLLLHVDWGGWQQEVRVLQTPAGNPPLPLHLLISPLTLLCCLWWYWVLCDPAIMVSCWVSDLCHDHPPWQQEEDHVI